MICNHTSVANGLSQTEQVLPRFSLMYPLSPHCAPQEFFTSQYSAVAPTTSTPWFTSFPQSLKTPDL